MGLYFVLDVWMTNFIQKKKSKQAVTCVCLLFFLSVYLCLFTVRTSIEMLMLYVRCVRGHGRLAFFACHPLATHPHPHDFTTAVPVPVSRLLLQGCGTWYRFVG